MQALVPVQFETDLQGEAVSAHDLYQALEVRMRYSQWIGPHLDDLIEGVDFVRLPLQSSGGRPYEEYLLKLDVAKHICMLSRSEKGREIREYFIKVEKAWNTPDLVIARALQVAQKKIENQQKTIIELKPKADFYDQVAGSKTAIEMGLVAKTLGIRGIGRNNLFTFLREIRVLQQNNIPYQEYVDRGYFRVIEQKFNKPNGEVSISMKTLVFQRGVDFIRKKLAEHNMINTQEAV